MANDDALSTAIAAAWDQLDADTPDPGAEGQPEGTDDEMEALDAALTGDDEELEPSEADDDSAEDVDTEDNPNPDDDESDDDEGNEEDQTYTVKVDGEEVEVTLDELLKGYSRHEDYTRKTQELASQRQEIEEQTESIRSWLAEKADNPSGFMAEIAASTESPNLALAEAVALTDNPTTAVAQILKHLAETAKLDDQFARAFNLEEVVANAKVAQDDDRVSKLERQLKEREDKEAEQARIREAVAELDRQWDAVSQAEGLEFASPQDEIDAKVAVMRFAKDNRIGNLETAYAAMAYRGQAPGKPKPQPKPDRKQVQEAAAKRKAKTRAMTRKPMAGSAPKAKPKDRPLRDDVEDALAELGFSL